MNSEIVYWLNKLIDYKRDLLAKTRDANERSNISYSIEAIKRAVRNISGLKVMIHSGDEAKKLNIGVGERLANRIDEILEHGKLKELEHYQNNMADIINELMTVPGIGFEQAKKFQQQGIISVEDLRRKWRAGQLKTTHAIDIGLKYYDYIKERIPRQEIDEIREWLAQWMPDTWLICGSYRRQCETSGDIDILITGENNNLNIIIKAMKESGFIVDDITPNARVKYMGICAFYEGKYRHIDIRYIEPHEWAPAVLYFTGPKEFNIKMRNRAIELGYLLNEYGLFNSNNERIRTDTEEQIFELLDMTYIPPEDRASI